MKKLILLVAALMGCVIEPAPSPNLTPPQPLSYNSCTWTGFQPSGQLSTIQVVDNCQATGGDVGFSFPQYNTIALCFQAGQQIETLFPGFMQFTLAHEYGHFVVGSDESAADCFAAQNMRGTCAVVGAYNRFATDSSYYSPRYGTGASRAAGIARCAGVTP